jgi:hypothetical protein
MAPGVAGCIDDCARGPRRGGLARAMEQQLVKRREQEAAREQVVR